MPKRICTDILDEPAMSPTCLIYSSNY